MANTNFLEWDESQVPYLLGTDYNEPHLHAIYAKDRYVEMADGPETLIIRKFKSLQRDTEQK